MPYPLPGTGPQGAQGSSGAAGAQGATGPQGIPGHTLKAVSEYAPGATGTHTFTASGAGHWALAHLRGGDAGGGGANAGVLQLACAAGGGQGGTLGVYIDLTSVPSITYAVGVAGAGGTTAPTNGGDGTETSITRSGTTVAAGGGIGGESSSGSVLAVSAGGQGGSASPLGTTAPFTVLASVKGDCGGDGIVLNGIIGKAGHGFAQGASTGSAAGADGSGGRAAANTSREGGAGREGGHLVIQEFGP